MILILPITPYFIFLCLSIMTIYGRIKIDMNILCEDKKMEVNNANYIGLTNKEVINRKNKGQINSIEDTITKSYKEIFFTNTITFFNLINIVLLAMVLFVGSYKNSLFIFLIVINTSAGIYQEIKAKRTLDRLTILNTSKVDVIRDNILQVIDINEIVLDDLIVLLPGYQIPVDSIVIDGQLEVNEALLTGEIDGVVKLKDDALYSGSYITSGKAVCKVIHIGNDNYIQQITKEAKEFKRHKSELNRCLDVILKIISIIIIPIGVLLFLKQFYVGHLDFQVSVINTVAAALGMIPEGLVLLTSVALTISILRLAKKQTLVQDLYCIETLARVDMLCLDKTGTLTEGKMEVEKVETLGHYNIDEVIGNLLFHLDDSNVTSIALKERFKPCNDYKAYYTIPFSSKRKYSGVSFENKGTYYLGALEFLFPKGNPKIESKCVEYALDGYRILLLVHSNEIVSDFDLPNKLTPCAIILLSDIVRVDAKDTLTYFNEQGVTCKIISGDDPITVSTIASKAGLQNIEYVNATTLHTHEDILIAVAKYNVFGRVTPKQKKEMVLCLKELGHTVAMTGDGINDVLAFKVADCSIAMASGSEAAKHAANLVLLDNNFSAMPSIVDEGRRVINNISMSASMFLIKTIFSALIAAGTILFGASYPFEPIQLSIISGCGVGIPTFFLTYEANFAKIEKDFLYTVFKNAFSTAFVIASSSLLIMNIGSLLGMNNKMLSTICVLITGWNYFLALRRIYHPMTVYRKVVIYTTQLLYFIAMAIGQNILSLSNITFLGLLILMASFNFSPLLSEWVEKISIICFKKIQAYYIQKKGG